MARNLSVLLFILACGTPRILLGSEEPSGAHPALSSTSDVELSELGLEELLDLTVVAASNRVEPLAEAPATVIVLRRSEILERGYRDLSEILDDLPGMDVVRPYGATWFKNYWRGYRNTIGDPFLVLVDGIVLNHLYFNTADVLATIPLSNIDRVEVVYGPASVVYGPNAFMGVVSISTENDRANDGPRERVLLSSGSWDEALADANVFYKNGQFRVSATGRFDDGELDPDAGERYEYTKSRYLSDRRLWGGIIDNRELGGEFSSPRQHRAFDLRAHFGTLELGLHYLRLDSGYGMEYSSDRAQNHAIWARPELGLFLRARQKPNAKLTGTTLLRWRESGVDNDSYFVESTPSIDSSGRPVQLVDFSYWQTASSSWSLFQDFEYRASELLTVAAGLKYERKDLQKAYNTIYGPSLPAGEVEAATYPYPDPPSESALANNRIVTIDKGVYVQGSLHLGVGSVVHLGLRNDHNSRYGSFTTVRAGWTGRFGRFGAKALYGTAFQEPTPRLLYGGWTGSGSDPDLDPETSRTIEVGGTWTTGRFGASAEVYRIENQDTIVNTASGAMNLGDREVLGFDLGGQLRLRPVAGFERLEIFGSFSRILSAKEKKVGADGSSLGDGSIGDLARSQGRLGASVRWGEHLTASLMARWMGDRRTVETNPIRSVDSYTTADLTLGWNDLLVDGADLFVQVRNLTDAEYDHPGIRDASAGNEPGKFDADGQWHGSRGFFPSLLPQPGRSVRVGLRLEF